MQTHFAITLTTRKEATFGYEELKDYNLDTYDSDDAEDEKNEGNGLSLCFHMLNSGFNLFSNIKGLSYYANNEEDPYITLDKVLPV